jgi:hypothetical protein
LAFVAQTSFYHDYAFGGTIAVVPIIVGVGLALSQRQKTISLEARFPCSGFCLLLESDKVSGQRGLELRNLRLALVQRLVGDNINQIKLGTWSADAASAINVIADCSQRPGHLVESIHCNSHKQHFPFTALLPPLSNLLM